MASKSGPEFGNHLAKLPILAPFVHLNACTLVNACSARRNGRPEKPAGRPNGSRRARSRRGNEAPERLLSGKSRSAVAYFEQPTPCKACRSTSPVKVVCHPWQTQRFRGLGHPWPRRSRRPPLASSGDTPRPTQRLRVGCGCWLASLRLAVLLADLLDNSQLRRSKRQASTTHAPRIASLFRGVGESKKWQR